MKRSSWSLMIVAVVTGVLVTAGDASGADGQPMIAGGANDTSSLTILANHDSGGTGMLVEGDSSGVQGYAAADGGVGVYGLADSNTGIGVEGDVDGSGSGVYGHSLSLGVGVNGQSDRGVGVEAQSDTGTALKVVGKAVFSRSGVVTVRAGASSLRASLGGVTAATMVLATAQQAKSVFVRAAVPTTDAFTIRLTGPAPSGGLRVAYFVLN